MNIIEMVITPEQAKKWLEQNNNRNRKLSMSVVAAYARDMQAGQWLDTHQNIIAFYEDGNLADGQHRLSAVVASGIPVKMRVAFGLDNGATFGIDSHRKRTSLDQVMIDGGNNWISKEVVSIVNLASSATGSRSRSTAHLVEMATAHRDRLKFAASRFSTKVALLTTAPVMTAICCAYGFEDEQRINQFCRVLLSGFPGDEGDFAAIRLREKLLRDGRTYQSSHNGRMDCMLLSQRALKAFCERDNIKRLYVPVEAIYPNFLTTKE